MLNIMVKSELEHQLKHSVLSLILDHQTFGSPPKNANFHQLAIFIDILIVQNPQLMLPMEPNLILLMDQVQLLDLLVKILLMLLDLKQKKLYLVKSLDLKVKYYIIFRCIIPCFKIRWYFRYGMAINQC